MRCTKTNCQSLISGRHPAYCAASLPFEFPVWLLARSGAQLLFVPLEYREIVFKRMEYFFGTLRRHTRLLEMGDELPLLRYDFPRLDHMADGFLKVRFFPAHAGKIDKKPPVAFAP